MGATKFICPNNDKVLIRQCLRNCPHVSRCLAKPILEAVAHSVADRRLGKYSVTELLRGTREIYLEKTTDYAVNPQDQIFAMHGTAMHLIGEYNSDDDIMTEARFENDIYSGQIDAYGDILSNGKKIILDYKVTSSYKAMIAMGYHLVDVPTGEAYKTGAKKGLPKTKKQWQQGGVRKVFDWAVQINAYRMLLEEMGYEVDELYIQMYIRDFSQKSVSDGVITQPMNLIKINKISDRWIKLYFETKKRRLEQALCNGEIPDHCSNRECWNERKCKDYCKVYESCMKHAENRDTEENNDNKAADEAA